VTAIVQPRLSTLQEVQRLLRWSGLIALDLETTGLDPQRDRIRLLSLSDGNRTIVLDCFEHDIRQVLPWLAGKYLVAHNAVFDLSFLWAAGLRELPETICTMLLSQLVWGIDTPKGFHSLGTTVLRELNQELDKTLQTSDWSGPLTAEQITYAGKDAQVLFPLLQALNAKIEAEGLARVADIELRALRAFVWMRMSGVPFDREAWLQLAVSAETRAKDMESRLNAASPAKGPPGLFGTVDEWNWNSPQQVKEVFQRLGVELDTTCDAQLAELEHPVADLLRSHREAATKIKMFGRDWLQHLNSDGRVYPDWKQIGADSGRTSCRDPNMQQIPRDYDDAAKKAPYRACVRPSVPERVLVKADYATLQMRIACKWAKDAALYKIFAADGDPHTETAKTTLGKSQVTKHDRQIAKSQNFGLLFGMSAAGLRVYAKMTYGVSFSKEEAEKLRTAWLRAYPGIAAWHARTKKEHCRETRCTSGRRRKLHPAAPDTFRLNSPVQGDEADGLKLSLGLLWERRAECPSAVPILAVHDEIVLEVHRDNAEQAAVWLKEAMEDGMRPWLDPVPVRVDTSILPTWGS
jgi:DNA polymerase-1